MTDGAGENTKTQDGRPRGKPMQKKNYVKRERRKKLKQTIARFFFFSLFMYMRDIMCPWCVYRQCMCGFQCVRVRACMRARLRVCEIGAV